MPADVLARFERLRGSRVLMASGTDEHGTPITYEADKKGVAPREFVDENNAIIVEDLRRLGMTYLFVSHDLNLVRLLSDRVLVMYLGRIVESGPVDAVFDRPRHPYTLGLLRSLPPRAEPIAGSAEAPWARPSGCRFRTRCPRAQDDCAQAEPELDAAGVACFHPLEN